MALTNSEKVKLDPALNTDRIGALITRGGKITVGIPIAEAFKWLRCAGAGDLVVQRVDNDKDGAKQFIFIPGAAISEWIPVLGYAVVASAVIDDVTYNTTATDIYWYGGL